MHDQQQPEIEEYVDPNDHRQGIAEPRKAARHRAGEGVAQEDDQQHAAPDGECGADRVRAGVAPHVVGTGKQSDDQAGDYSHVPGREHTAEDEGPGNHETDGNRARKPHRDLRRPESIDPKVEEEVVHAVYGIDVLKHRE